MCFTGSMHQLICLPVASMSQQLNLNSDVCIFEVVRLVRPSSVSTSSVSNFTLFSSPQCRNKCTERFQILVIQKEHRLRHLHPDSNIIVMQLKCKEPQRIWMKKDYLVRACADDSHVFPPVLQRQRSFTYPTHMTQTWSRHVYIFPGCLYERAECSALCACVCVRAFTLWALVPRHLGSEQEA